VDARTLKQHRTEGVSLSRATYPPNHSFFGIFSFGLRMLFAAGCSRRSSFETFGLRKLGGGCFRLLTSHQTSPLLGTSRRACLSTVTCSTSPSMYRSCTRMAHSLVSRQARKVKRLEDSE
jgi:hypothetical protein